MVAFIFLSCLQKKLSDFADVDRKLIDIKVYRDYYIILKGSKGKA